MVEERLRIPEHLTTRGPADTMRATVEDLFVASGMPREDAVQAADMLIWTDLRGVDSHGASNMMAFYLRAFKARTTNPAPAWSVVRETPGTAHIDCDRGLGLAVGPAAMRMAIAKAVGIGSVVAGNGRHFGAAGDHAAMALEHDIIGISMTVGGLQVVPTFGSKPMVGLNPLSVAAPTMIDQRHEGRTDRKFKLPATPCCQAYQAPISANPHSTTVLASEPISSKFLTGLTGAVSSSKCNELMMMLKKVKGVRHKQFCRALPSEALTRAVIRSLGDDIKIDLSETGEVYSLGEILPEQAVGVLVDVALPRTVRVGEVDLDAGHLGEPFVLSHFTPPIVGQGQTPLRVDAAEHGSETSDCRSDSCMIHFSQCDEERASLNQRANGGRIARTLDQIALPMARHDAVFDFQRAHMAADHVRNGAAPICTPSARPPTLAGLAQAGDQLGTQLTARHGVKRGVD